MKKILMLTIAVLLAFGMFSFSACGPKDELIVVTNAAFAPFEFTEGDEFKGIDMDLARAIAKELNMKLKIVNTEFESVITSVQSGQADIAMAGLTVSEARAQMVDFSDSYFDASQYIIVKSGDTTFDTLTTAEQVDSAINSMGANAKIGYQLGTVGDYYANGNQDWEFAGFASAVKTGSDNGSNAVLDLISDRINMVIIDEMPARALVAAKTGIKIVEIPLTEEEYAIGVNKDKPELLTKINAALAKFKADGTFDGIVAKYFED